MKGGGGFEGRGSSKTVLTCNEDEEGSVHGHWGLNYFPNLGPSDFPVPLHEDGLTFPS